MVKWSHQLLKISCCGKTKYYIDERESSKSKYELREKLSTRQDSFMTICDDEKIKQYKTVYFETN